MNEIVPQGPTAKEIFLKAAALSCDTDRSAFLDQVCAGNPELRQNMDAMLRVSLGSAPNPLDQLRAMLGQTGDLRDNTLTEVAQMSDCDQTIGPYRILQQIGEGAFGTVYMAEQSTPVRRKVALKILKAGMDTREVIARFEAERQALAIMDHPHIAKVLDAGATAPTAEGYPGRPYFVMELVRGLPLTEFCDELKASTRDRLELFVDVCRAVQHAHLKGIIHRDLKPTNVLVSQIDGQAVPQVIDFGIAKALGQQLTDRTLYTGFGQLIGTPLYMSPEQASLSGVDVDTRSDVYSLGVMLYELLTGTTPFTKESFSNASFDELRRIIREQEPPRPSARLTTLQAQARSTIADRRQVDQRKISDVLKGELDWIVMKALEKDRNRRYESPSALAADISRYVNNEPVEACPPSRWYRLTKLVSRHRAAWTTAALVVAALTLGMSLSVWQAVRAMRAEKRVTQQLVRAQQAEQRAESEAAIAEAVVGFLTDELLSQADPDRGGDRNINLRTAVDQAAAAIESNLASQPLVEARVRHTLAKTYQTLGEYAQAQGHAVRAAELGKSLSSADDHRVIESERLSADSTRRQGDLQTARGLLDELLPRARQTLGPEHQVTLRVMVTAALTMWEQGHAREAESLLRQADEIQRQEGSEAPRDPAWILAKLAVVMAEQGRHDEAEELYRQSLTIRSRVLGEEHPQTLETMNNLANTLRDRGRYQEADALHRQTHEILSRVLGEEHPSTLLSMKNIARSMRDLGRLQEAEGSFRQTVARYRRVLGDDHPDTLGAMNDLAITCAMLDRYQQAEEMIRETLAVSARVLGEDHPFTLNTTNNLAGILVDQGRLDEGEVLLRQTLERRRRVLGEEHPSTLSSMYNLARTIGLQDRLSEQDQLLRQTLEVRRRILRNEHPDTLECLNLLGVSLMQQKRYAEAETIHREALEVQRRVLGGAHPYTLASMYNLANVIDDQGRHQEAEEPLRTALESCRYVLGDSHNQTLNCMYALGCCLNSQGKRDQAIAEWRRIIEINPEYALVYTTLGNELIQAGDLSGGIAVLKQGAEQDDANSHSLLAWHLSVGADPQLIDAGTAVEHGMKATQLRPEDAHDWENMGVAQFRNGQDAEAIASFKRSKQLGRRLSVDATFFLAMAYHQSGNTDAAQGTFQDAVRRLNGKTNRFQAEAERVLEINPAPDARRN